MDDSDTGNGVGSIANCQPSTANLVAEILFQTDFCEGNDGNADQNNSRDVISLVIWYNRRYLELLRIMEPKNLNVASVMALYLLYTLVWSCVEEISNMGIMKTYPKGKMNMKLTARCMFLAMLCTLVLALNALAQERITVKNAQGGYFSVIAYNQATSKYFNISGTLSSDSYGIDVNDGYGCTLSVTMGMSVGTRNLYEEHDPLNPIFDVTKKSTYLLELTRIGTGSSSKAMGVFSSVIGGSTEFKRQPLR